MYRRSSRKSPSAARACWGGHLPTLSQAVNFACPHLFKSYTGCDDQSQRHSVWTPPTKRTAILAGSVTSVNALLLSLSFSLSLSLFLFLSSSLTPSHLLFIFLPQHLVISTGRREAVGESSPLTFSPLEPQVYLHCGGGKGL